MIYWFACPSGRVKNLFLTAASYLFYGWWDPRFLLLIILITGVAYGAGRMIDSPRQTARSRRAIMWER